MIELKDLNAAKIKELISDEGMRRYIIAGAIALAGMVYAMTCIIPGTLFFLKTGKEAAEMRTQIESVSGRVNRIDGMTEALDKIKTELEGYSEGLPGQKDIPEFLEGLASIAKVSGVNIISITPSELRSAQESDGKIYYAEMPIRISAKSGYHQLAQFISNLEKGSRFVSIEDLRIQYNEGSPRQHDISMTLKTYVSGQ
ncbi:MAG: type 4a pilus biogenesis protein PilO [Candidatus Omnitrophota bacterium]|nr:type 4a pilus biogenesis protein PilO [Candidatus Omnitrophota bacterium]